MSDTEKLTIYADGSISSTNNGGVGIRIISVDSTGEEIIYDSYRARYPNANSGQMEIVACVEALEEAERMQLTLLIKQILVLTDSKYVSDNYKTAMFEWSVNRWLRKSGRPVQDAHLWKQLVKKIANYSKNHIYVDIKWVKGHEKDEHNIAVDAMARKASRLPLDKMPKSGPISISQPRKVVASPKMEIGSVKANGQRVSIKILSSKLLKPQNVWCYQYQVMSITSPFCNLVDQIFSTISLDVNQTYYVKFNTESENPRIKKMYWKIK